MQTTPGPWKWVGTKKSPDSYSYLRGGRDGSTLVGVACDGFTDSDANARLIAAAPELLEIVKRWLRLHYDTGTATLDGLEITNDTEDLIKSLKP